MGDQGSAPEVIGVPAWGRAVVAGMASYLDAGIIITASIAFVLYAEAGFDIGPAELGLLSALLTFGLAIGAGVGGRLGDLIGRRRVLFADLVVLAAGLSCLTFASSLPWLIVGAAITGLAMGADLPASISLAAEQGPVEYRGRLVSVTNVLWLAGIVGAVLMANIVGWLGMPPLLAARTMFGHLLLVTVVVWLLRLRVRESAIWLSAVAHHRASSAAERRSVSPSRLRALQPYRSALIGTGLYYLLWNLQANTGGQFNAFLFTQVAGGSLATFNLLGLVSLPLGLLTALLGLRIVDTRWRMPAYVAASLIGTLALLPPALFGVTVPSMLAVLILPGLLAPFAAENLYRVWTQELFPTLLRSTAQGATISFCRFCTGVFALVTPVIATASPRGLYWILFACAATSMLIGWLWVSRLPRPDEVESSKAPAT